MSIRVVHHIAFLAAIASLSGACAKANSNGSSEATAQTPSLSNGPTTGDSEAAAARPAPAKNPSLPAPTMTPVSHRGTDARLLVGTLAPGDPLGLAIRWKGGTNYRDRPNVAAILKSLSVTVQGPSGTQQLQVDGSGLDPSTWAVSTVVLQLTAAGVTEKYTGLSVPWAKDALDMKRPGGYVVAVTGATSSQSDPASRPFQTAPLTVVVDGNRPMLATYEKTARAELQRQAPETVRDPKTLLARTESGFIADSAIEIAPGVLRFRYAVMEGFRWGYDLHSITIAADGAVTEVKKKSIGTCIASGVLVEGEHGAQPIETVAVGERIWGYDTEQKRRVLVRIREVRVSEADKVLAIGDLRVTGTHPVYVDDAWQQASAVRRGSLMIGSGGEPFAVAGVDAIAGDHTVYSLVVEEPHTYFAGGVLVHNKDRMYVPELDDPWLFMWSDDPGRQ